MSALDPRRVEEVFDAAAALPEGEVRAYLDQACAGDRELRDEIEALLAAGARADGAEPERIAARAVLAEAAFEATVPADAAGPGTAMAGMPEAVGRFAVVRKLGEGGMGVVYEAHDARLDRKVAVKLVRLGHGGSAGRARLLREAQAMAKVAHPNVVAIYEVGLLGEELFVAMELVEGETLSAWLRREPRGWRDALAMYVGAGRGLAAAHAAGIVHRDFKPDNVLVGADGRPRVVDFGLARAHGAEPDALAPRVAPSGGAFAVDLTLAGAVMGTPGYMSPEHFNGEASDPRSDQFSFAVAVYRALFGSAPFEGDDLAALHEAVLRGPAAVGTSEVPPRVIDAVLRALAPARDARFPSMQELLAELERPLAQRPELDPTRSRAKRRAATGLLALAALATLIPWTGPRPAVTADGLLLLALFAAGVLAVLGFAFRSMLVDSAYNRRVAALFALPVLGFALHRALAAHLHAEAPGILVADAVSMAVVLGFAGLTFERWMALGAPVWIACALVATAWPEWAGPAFGGLLLLSAALPLWLWRDPRQRRPEKKDAARVGSSRRSAD